MTRRALHFVLKIGNLKKNVEFFRDRLKMKVLRHEVFDKACEAACNGPYDNKWSKTMIGYGAEDDHFVLELTYNYSVGSYKLGNDLQYIKIGLIEELFDKCKSSGTSEGNLLKLNSPDGYKFILEKRSKNEIFEVCLASSNLKESISYWTDILSMNKILSTDSKACFKYADKQAALVLHQISEPIDHKSAFGRIAFSCPAKELKPLQAAIEKSGRKVLTPYLSLDTPGKATVQVVILSDPDGHEICFVGDEGFRQLSQVDPHANDLIEKSMKEDKSDEWYQKKNIKKGEA